MIVQMKPLIRPMMLFIRQIERTKKQMRHWIGFMKQIRNG